MSAEPFAGALGDGVEGFAEAFLARVREKRRSRLVVEIDLDPVPGWGDNAEDHRALVQRHLDDAVPHYHPTVTIDANTAADTVIAEAERLCTERGYHQAGSDRGRLMADAALIAAAVRRAGL